MHDLDKALAFANYQVTLTEQKKLLKQKFDDACIVASNGGLFQITLTFLSGIKTISEEAQWVQDANGNPIWIANISEFVTVCYNTYHNALSVYGQSYEQLKKQRSVKSLVGL
jgi:hypothetical protein